MKFRTRAAALTLCAALLVFLLSACSAEETNDSVGSSTESTTTPAPDDLSTSDTASPRTPAALDLTGAASITLSGGTVQIDGSGASESGGVITITAGGTYAVSGILDEGRIIVNAPGADVTLALNGASITCSYGSPLYVYRSSSTTIHLVEGTENTLADGESYTFADSLSSAAEEEPNACLYSKSDLIIQGAGALAVEANYNNGLTSKDTLEIYDAVIAVTAVNHGINGKDSNTVDSATISVTCGGDAIRSTNDSDSNLGWVSISNSTLNLTAGEDGIQAETWAALSSVSCTVISGGGSAVTPNEDVSAKGIKAGTTLTLASGVYTLDCSDDVLHANGDVTISGGIYTISTGDDAFHADGTLTVSGGQINVLKSYEGLEGSDVNISGGEITIVSSDDGVNAAGGADASGFGGFGGMGGPFSGAGDYTITISGGSLHVTAGGDGLDSNGNIVMSGGTVLVSSSGGADGALDYESSFTLTGGLLFAASAGNMAQAPTDPEQYALSVSSSLSAGTYLQFLTGGGTEYVFQLPSSAVHVVFSAPDLSSGDTCAVSYDGSYTGSADGMLCTGGTYSGGTLLTELTISDALTTYGQVGRGGSRGGNMIGEFGQHGSFGRGGKEGQGGGFGGQPGDPPNGERNRT